MKYNYKDSIATMMSKALSRWKKELLKAFNEYDITTEQWSLLVRLWEEDGISQTKLAQRTFKDLPTINRILNKLKAKDLIERKNNSDDLRVYLVFLTQKGKDLEEKINPIADQIKNKGLKNIKEEDLEVAKRVLINIFTNLA